MFRNTSDERVMQNQIDSFLRNGNIMLTEALCAAMAHKPVQLRKAFTQHRDRLAKPLWDECMFVVHIQDHRLTNNERKVLAAIGERLYGKRVVV